MELATQVKASTTQNDIYHQDDDNKKTQELFAIFLESLATSIVKPREISVEANHLAQTMRAAGSISAAQNVKRRLQTFFNDITLRIQDKDELAEGLLHLLTLLLENMECLVEDDIWLSGQIEMIREAISPPFSTQKLLTVECRMEEIIENQRKIKQKLVGTQNHLESMVTKSINHLNSISNFATCYQSKLDSNLENSLELISSPENYTNAASALTNATRIMQINTRSSVIELQLARKRLREAKIEVIELRTKLGRASRLARYDQLTGALNRNGMDYLFKKETANTERKKKRLSIAFLDIDDFKKTNDTFGHDAGDYALIHLAAILRGTLHSSDVVIRYGGEEFILLLPETNLEEARLAVKRIQSELINKLLIYKRILLYKQCNFDYAGNYTIEMIANKIKLLIHK